MGSKSLGSLLILGNSFVARALARVVHQLNIQVQLVTTSAEVITQLGVNPPDLLLVELTALGSANIGLADIADACHERGTRLVLLTVRSVDETTACASLLGAIATLNKRAPLRATAERVTALVEHAHCVRELGIVFDPGMPWIEEGEEIAALV